MEEAEKETEKSADEDDVAAVRHPLYMRKWRMSFNILKLLESPRSVWSAPSSQITDQKRSALAAKVYFCEVFNFHVSNIPILFCSHVVKCQC